MKVNNLKVGQAARLDCNWQWPWWTCRHCNWGRHRLMTLKPYSHN